MMSFFATFYDDIKNVVLIFQKLKRNLHTNLIFTDAPKFMSILIIFNFCGYCIVKSKKTKKTKLLCGQFMF